MRIKLYFSLLFLCAFLISSRLRGQTMKVGDIAFIGYNTGGLDGFSFIALANLPAGETLYLTEQGWDGNVWMSASTEVHLMYVIPSGITIGKIITIVETTADAFTVTGGGSVSIVQGSNFSLSGGDQILAYQSATTVAPAAPKFISGVHGDYNSSKYNATTTWNPVSANSTFWANSDCALPTDLTNGVNCISLYPAPGPEHANAKYNGALSGTDVSVRTAINTASNWVNNDLGTSIAIQPSNYPIPNITFALPLVLLNYNVKLQANGSVFLSWATATESNTDYFLLARSSNGRDFNEINRTKAQVTSNNTFQYNYTDDQVVEGNNYYRLTQYDIDGAFKHLGIKEVVTGSKKFGWSIFPNPAISDFTISISGPAQKNVQVRIFDLNGKLVFDEKLQALNGKINTKFGKKLASGIYNVEIPGQGIRKLVIK